MKKSEMLMHMQRVYGIRHVMVESGHLSIQDFFHEMLQHMEEKGMLPPKIAPSFHKSDLPLEEMLNSGLNRWENEYEEKTPTFG